MATKIKGDLQTWPGGAVRISMSAKVANDLDTFKKGVAAFAERLGCPECFSGFDCTFESERDFVIDADVEGHADRGSNRAGGFPRHRQARGHRRPRRRAPSTT